MGRIFAAVILGYITMAVVIMVAFGASYPLLGVDRLFTPGTYNAAAGWITLSFVLGLASAAAGGWVCARIAPHTLAPQWLAGVVLVLGMVLAIPAVMDNGAARGGPRPDGVTLAAAMAHARQPGWVAILNPIVGAAGVLLGAGRRRKAG